VNLFRPVSPMLGWFCLMEIISAVAIVGYWVEVVKGSPPWQLGRVGGGIVVTVLFVGSNLLLFSHRRLAVAGLIASWLLMALLFSPIL
jgi:hypothetical protein